MSISIFSYSQVRKDARKLYDQVFPLSLTASYHSDKFTGSNNATRFTYQLKNSGSAAIGIDYNFAQTGRFNFKVGLYAKRFSNSTQIDIISPTTSAVERTINDNISPLWTLHTPLTIEYIRRINSKIYLSFYAGYEFQYFNYRDEDDIEVININSNEDLSIRTNDNTVSIFGGYHYGFGAYFKLKNQSLLKIDVTFQKRNTARTSQEVALSNSQTDTVQKSFFLFDNSHTAFTIRYAPPLKWFSKKSRYKRGI